MDCLSLEEQETLKTLAVKMNSRMTNILEKL